MTVPEAAVERYHRLFSPLGGRRMSDMGEVPKLFAQTGIVVHLPAGATSRRQRLLSDLKVDNRAFSRSVAIEFRVPSAMTSGPAQRSRSTQNVGAGPAMPEVEGPGSALEKRGYAADFLHPSPAQAVFIEMKLGRLGSGQEFFLTFSYVHC
jgi:hypothetical protein